MARISKNCERTADGKWVGYIYERVLNADKNKAYVGETTDVPTRDQKWRQKSNKNYGGHKITEARRLYNDLDNDWTTNNLERVVADTKEELAKLLDEREDYWMIQKNSVENGFNDNLNKQKTFSEQHKANISKNHRHYQSEETKAILREKSTGRKKSDDEKHKISVGNSGKTRSDEMRKAQSERMKGVEPTAATEGAKKWREENGGGSMKGKKMSASAIEKMRESHKGIAVRAIFPDGTTKDYPKMYHAAKDLGLNIGSVDNCLKHGGTTKSGIKFIKL